MRKSFDGHLLSFEEDKDVLSKVLMEGAEELRPAKNATQLMQPIGRLDFAGYVPRMTDSRLRVSNSRCKINFGQYAAVRNPLAVGFWLGKKPRLASVLLMSSKLAVAIGADYGYLHEANSYEAPLYKDFLLNPRVIEGLDFSFPARVIGQYLPVPHWLSIFGQAYIDLIGRDVLLSAPVYAVYVLKSGHIALQLTEHFEDCEYRPDLVGAAQDRVRAHFPVDL